MISFKNITMKLTIKLSGIVLVAFLGMCCQVIPSTAIAQRIVSGRVVDSNGSPMGGVVINWKNTSTQVVSGDDGRFSVVASGNQDVLEFWYLGKVNKEVSVGDRTTIEVVLEDDMIEMDEVVVLGYGSVRKRDLTGAVSKFTPTDVRDNPMNSVEQVLQGRVSGVQVTQSSGGPAAGINFLVRGANSTSGNQPLIVIDGYPVDPGNSRITSGGDGNAITAQPTMNPLANIDPNEIESIEILKDASATAIYGSRGANGVVLITTKRGKVGEDNVEFNYRSDISQVGREIEVLNTDEFISFIREASQNSSVALPPGWTDEQLEVYRKTNNDWQQEVYRVAPSNNYQLTVRGGDARTKYAVAGNYTDQNGVIKNSAFNRAGIRVNLDRELSKYLTLGLNLSASKSTTNLSVNSSSTGSISANVVTSALLFAPFREPYNADGDINQNLESNPLTIVNLIRDQYDSNLFYGNLTGKLNLTKALSLNMNFGGNLSNGLRQAYHPRGTLVGNQRKGYAYRSQNNNFNYLSEFTLNFDKDLGKSRVNAVLGYTWQQWKNSSMGTSTSDFPNDNLTFYSFQSGNAPGATTTSYQESALASVLGRINYSLQGKYLFTLTGRADGSTRLAAGNKWAFFPSAAVGWNINEEEFLKGHPVVSTLKIRGSYGVSGNQSVGIGSTAATLNSGVSSTTVIGDAIVKGYILNNIANPQLGWEITQQLNAGLDFGVLKNRYALEVNYYRKRTENLLIQLPIPTATGFKTYTANAGAVTNSGVELDLTAQVLSKSLKWRINGNISFNRNQMADLGPLGDQGIIFGPNYLNFGAMLDQPIHVAMLGSQIGAFYGYRIDGIYQNAQEVADGPEANSAKPGDFRFVDLNGDNAITSDDRTIVGNPYPDYVFGITNSFSWKRLSLSFLFQGSIGNEVANLNRFRLDAMNSANQYNISKVAWDGRWRGEGTSDRYPRAVALGGYFNSRFSDFIVEDASYVRLKNVNISYTVPIKAVEWLKSVRLFATATNLLTFTDYSGYDPEVSANFNNALTPGVDNGTYPQTRTFSFGANLNF